METENKTMKAENTFDYLICIDTQDTKGAMLVKAPSHTADVGSIIETGYGCFFKAIYRWWNPNHKEIEALEKLNGCPALTAIRTYRPWYDEKELENE